MPFIPTANPIPVALMFPGRVQIANGSVDATGAQILAADENRKWGVLVQNVDTAAPDSLKVGTVTGDAVLTLAPVTSAVNTPNTLFIPGTSAVFAKSTNGTLTTDYAIMYL